MKLLFDQNLSPRLVNRLNDLYPNSAHVCTLGLNQASDREVRQYALQHGFLLVTKDADFGELCLLLGFPPKVIWIRRGNCATATIEQILRGHYPHIEGLDQDSGNGTLTIF